MIQLGRKIASFNKAKELTAPSVFFLFITDPTFLQLKIGKAESARQSKIVNAIEKSVTAIPRDSGKHSKVDK